jgi:Uma2 family endonuclease
MAIAISRRRFTVDDYHRMAQTGILSERDRVELIDGEVVAMTPIGPRHCASVDRATRAFVNAAGEHAIVRIQGSVRLTLYTEPEPDVALLRPRADFYSERHPGPADILLLVEVADSSLDYDRGVKTRVYALAGVAEYWLVDLNAMTVSCHSDPHDGTYRAVHDFGPGQPLAPILLPECAITTTDLLGA